MFNHTCHLASNIDKVDMISVGSRRRYYLVVCDNEGINEDIEKVFPNSKLPIH